MNNNFLGFFNLLDINMKIELILAYMKIELNLDLNLEHIFRFANMNEILMVLSL